MSWFAALLVRHDDHWTGAELDLAGCESLGEIGERAIEADGDAPLRLVLVEQDDEYAAIVRVDGDDSDEPRAFLSDGHAADAYPLAAAVAEGLPEIGGDVLADDDDAPPAHDAAPFGDPDIVADLGTSGSDLLTMCDRGGTLPIDMLVAICESAGCAEIFDDLRA